MASTTHEAPWAFANLTSNKAEKCQIAIADTVLFSDGQGGSEPKWLFTSKVRERARARECARGGRGRCACGATSAQTARVCAVALRSLTRARSYRAAQNGEVVRKRSIDPHSLRERFTRQALDSTKNVNGFAATLRRTDGTLRFVGRDALAMMTARWPPAEPTVAALQGYVAPAGSDGTVHVNKYGLKNDKGAVITSTYSYCSLPSADGSGGAASVAAQGSAAALSMTRPDASATSMREDGLMHCAAICGRRRPWVLLV